MGQWYAKPVWMWFWAAMGGAFFLVGVVTGAIEDYRLKLTHPG